MIKLSSSLIKKALIEKYGGVWEIQIPNVYETYIYRKISDGDVIIVKWSYHKPKDEDFSLILQLNNRNEHFNNINEDLIELIENGESKFLDNIINKKLLFKDYEEIQDFFDDNLAFLDDLSDSINFHKLLYTEHYEPKKLICKLDLTYHIPNNDINSFIKEVMRLEKRIEFYLSMNNFTLVDFKYKDITDHAYMKLFNEELTSMSVQIYFV